MARLIISVDVAGVRAIAGPVTGAAVLYDSEAREPIFAMKNKRGELVRFSLREPKKIPNALIPGIVAQLYAAVPAVLHGAAALTVLAHLQKLIAEREVREEPTGHYRPAFLPEGR